MKKLSLLFAVLIMTSGTLFAKDEDNGVFMPEAKLCASQTHYYTACVASGEGCDPTECYKSTGEIGN